MSTLVVPRAQQLANMASLVGLAAYTGAKLHLYDNDFTPSELSLLADFTPAIFSGYTAQAVTWSTPFRDLNGVVVSSSGELLFAQAGATGDSVYGAYLTDTAGTVLLASARLDTAPFVFAINGDTLPLLVKLDLTNGLLSISPVP